MDNKNKNLKNKGTINISDDVIATIASVAVAETEGVYGLATSIAGEFVSKFSKKNLNKGIKINSNETDIQIDINLIMEYGVRIPEIAWEVQENVKKAIESMSGLKVVKINIHVAGINFDNDITTGFSE